MKSVCDATNPYNTVGIYEEWLLIYGISYFSAQLEVTRIPYTKGS